MSNINVKERRKYFKREARALLKYNYVRQIFMTAVAVLISFGINAVKLNVSAFLTLEYNITPIPVEMIFDLILLLISLPLYIGIIYVDTGLFEGENLTVGEMFRYFSSPSNLIDCYRFILSMTLRLCAFALPFFFFGAVIARCRELLGEILPASITVDIVMLCVSVVYMAAFLSCAVFMTRYFAAVFIFVKNPCLSIYDVVKKSSQLMKGNKIEAIKLILSFTLWIALSRWLAGALFIFFTLPYIMLAYTSFMSYLLVKKEINGEFLSPSNDYIDCADSGAGSFGLSEVFENPANPFDIIDIDEDYDATGQLADKSRIYDTDVMNQKTKVN